MRFIVTTEQTVEQFKKQAKKLQRKGSGTHSDLLNKVARAAGYDHWHHVTLCLERTRQKNSALSLAEEIEGITRAAREGIGKLVVTGPGASASQPFVLFSTTDGDAWLLDPDEYSACCLRWREVDQQSPIANHAEGLAVEWDGPFELLGDFFKVETEHPEIGRRAIAGYPIDELRHAITRAQSVDRKIADIFGQDGAVDLTEDVIQQLISRGWSEEQLRLGAQEGARYSPMRNTLLYPAVGDAPMP